MRRNTESAFPRSAAAFATPTGMHGDPGEAGMTLRDYFAGKALEGSLASGRQVVRQDGSPAFGITTTKVAETFARDAYLLADAMLAERAKAGERS